ncbi:MAG: polyprenyl synthetase family protein [Planctomycetes bacterium]|nr:polyprenyl synthetase family protein [Planctomycetota bacterium]
MSEPSNATATESSLASTHQDDWLRKRQRIEEALDAYSQFDGDCPAVLRDAMRHSLLAPGKRLRPLLVLLATDACGVDWQIAIPAGCALEMVHTYSLIHDDLPAMDDDDLRRGLPTCHKLFGEAMAILAGDALLAFAFELLSRGLSDAGQAAACVRELARAAGPTALVGGQADDLAAEFQAGDLQQLQHIHRRKTGALLVAALRMGGVIGRANDEQMDALGAYGQKLGLAFQIVDDLLDTQGNDRDLGKRAGKDQRHGKLTFPGLLGMESSVRRAATLVDEAIEATKVFGERANALQALARYVLERRH